MNLNAAKLDSQDYRMYTGRSEFEKALHTLMGLLKGISIDQVLNQLELEELQYWIQSHSAFARRDPFKEIFPLVQHSIEDRILDQDEVEDITWLCKQYFNENPYYDVFTKDIQVLQGILHGILSDNLITKDELVGLKKWLTDHDHMETLYPYDEINSIVSNVLEDGIIDDNEQLLLKALFSDFIDTRTSYNLNQEEFDQLRNEMNIKGICALEPKIEFKNKLFCFTGASSRTQRSQIADLILERGGKFNNNVIGSTNYLIVGDEGNPCWAFSCYGRKIEKAINLRKQGKQIVIAHEVDFWSSV